MSLWLNKWEKKFLLALLEYSKFEDWEESLLFIEDREDFNEAREQLINKIELTCRSRLGRGQ